jgi:hypothetical protein
VEELEPDDELLLDEEVEEDADAEAVAFESLDSEDADDDFDAGALLDDELRLSLR